MKNKIFVGFFFLVSGICASERDENGWIMVESFKTVVTEDLNSPEAETYTEIVKMLDSDELAKREPGQVFTNEIQKAEFVSIHPDIVENVKNDIKDLLNDGFKALVAVFDLCFFDGHGKVD